jgi:hypothetical protein
MRKNMSAKNTDSRCKARTKNGKPCRAAATPGGLCFFHANPNKASELGRIGGRSKRPTVPENAEPLPALDSAVAVRDAVDRLIADVYAGKLHPKIAAGLAPLLQLQLRALDATETEGRLSRLERLVAKREQRSKGTGGKWPDKPNPIRFRATSVAPSDSQKETGPPKFPEQQGSAGITDKGSSSAEPVAPQPVSDQSISELQALIDSGVDLRIEDKAARDLQAELDEQKRVKSGGVVRVQDAAARALEQQKSELPTRVEEQSPSNPAALESTTTTGEASEKDVEQLPAGLQQAPAESGEPEATTGAPKSNQEIMEELMKTAQEAWGRGDLLLSVSRKS